MLHSVQIAEAVKAAARIPSDYALAKHLGVTRGAVSAWHRRGVAIGPDQAEIMAKTLGVDPALIILATQFERANSDVVRDAYARAYYALGGADLDALVAKLVPESEKAPVAMTEASEDMAEAVRFELTVGSHLRRFSRPLP